MTDEEIRAVAEAIQQANQDAAENAELPLLWAIAEELAATFHLSGGDRVQFMVACGVPEEGTGVGGLLLPPGD